MILWWLFLMFSKVFTEFYAGRIKPGKFEYPKLNGLMLVLDAKEKCEYDKKYLGFAVPQISHLAFKAARKK